MTVHVVGVGSDRGADRLGPAVVDYLERSKMASDGVALARCTAPGRDLRTLLRGAQAAVLVDAVCDQTPPGTVLHLALERIRGDRRQSSHGVGVADILGLMRMLGELPPWLRIVGVSVGDPPAAAPAPAWVEAGAAAVCTLLHRRAVDVRAGAAACDTDPPAQDPARGEGEHSAYPDELEPG